LAGPIIALWPWLALAGLGAFHGLNPAMGWLFAVALGLHRQSRAVVLGALAPIAFGHALSIAAVVAAVLLLGFVVDQTLLRRAAGALLLGWAAYHALYGARHRVRFGMTVGYAGLAAWSFLMASAHGAGLMVLPFVLGSAAPMPAGAEHGHGMSSMASARDAAWASVGGVDAIGIVAPLVHTLGYLATTAILASVVYERIGVQVLRRGWINFDLIWGVAMVGAGIFALFP
jgi:hypothetical protein